MRVPERGAGSLRAGARVSDVRCEGSLPRGDELAGAVAGATAAGGVGESDFEWNIPSWLKPVTAAVIDPTSAAVAVSHGRNEAFSTGSQDQ